MSTVTIPSEKLQAIESMAKMLLVEVAELRKGQRVSRSLVEKPHVKRALDRFNKNLTRKR